MSNTRVDEGPNGLGGRLGGRRSDSLLALGPVAVLAEVLRVNSFPNAKALPVYVGIANGLFAKRGLTVEVETTESSQS